MIYIDTASEDIYYNFAVEEYFSAEKDLGDSIFLLWRTPPMLVMGQFIGKWIWPMPKKIISVLHVAGAAEGRFI